MGMFDFIGDFIGDVTGSNKASDAAQQASANTIASTEKLAGASNQTIRDMYQTGRQDQLPFITPSLSALPMLQSAILGGKVQYQDPNYQRLTSFDPEYATAQKNFPTPYLTDQSGNVIHNPAPQLYRAPDGSYTDKPPMLTADYKPQETPGFQYQLEQQQKLQDRSLRALGRSNSTYGMDERNKLYNNLVSTDYNQGLNRLASLAYGGQGTAGNVAGQGNSAAGQIAGVNSNAAGIIGGSLTGLGNKLGDLYTNYSPMNVGLNFAKVGASFI